jgi:excisionase family DNA binding protein
MKPFPKVLALRDAAEALGVSREYVRRLAVAGKLRFQETSAGKIFLASDVAVFKKHREQRARTDTRIRLRP